MKYGCGRFGRSFSNDGLVALHTRCLSKTRDLVEHVITKHNRSADTLATKASDGIRLIWVSHEISKYSSERSEPFGMEAKAEMGRVMGSSFARNNEMTKLLHSRGSVDHVQLIRSVVSAQTWIAPAWKEQQNTESH